MIQLHFIRRESVSSGGTEDGASSGQSESSNYMAVPSLERDRLRTERSNELDSSKPNTPSTQRRKGGIYLVLDYALRCIRPFGPLLFLSIYCCLGAAMFIYIEEEAAKDGSRLRDIRFRLVTHKYVMHMESDVMVAMELARAAGNGSDGQPDIRPLLDDRLGRYAIELGIKKPDELRNWHFAAAVFYCATLLTTIGYGNVYPSSKTGQLVTIFYSAIGIPITLYVLADFGEKMCWFIWKLYSVSRRCLSRSKPTDSNDKSPPKDEFRSIAEIPFLLALFLTVGWVMGGSAVFLWFEDTWSYTEAVYFFFQSLTTIGLGDITPKDVRMCLASFALILIGMSLVSMCWNLVQIKLETLVEELMARIQASLVEEEEDESGSESDSERLMENGGVKKKKKKDKDKKKSKKSMIIAFASGMTEKMGEKVLKSMMSKDQLKQIEKVKTKKAGMKNVGAQTQGFGDSQSMQTSPVNVKEAADAQDVCTQTAVSLMTTSRRHIWNFEDRIPYRETSRSPYREPRVPAARSVVRSGSVPVQRDDVRSTIDRIGTLLNECHGLLPPRSQTATANNQ